MLLKFSFNHDACHLSKDLIYFLCVYLWERKGSSRVKKITYWFLELKYLCEYLLMLLSIINQQKKFSNGCKGFQVRNLTKRYPAFSLSSLPSQHLISYILILLIMVNHPSVKLFPLSKSGPWYYNWTRQWKRNKKLRLKRDLSFHTIAYIHISYEKLYN